MSARESIANHVQAILQFKAMGNSVRRLRQQHPPGSEERGAEERVRLPASSGIHPADVLRRKGPFRWVALSGDAEDIARTDAKVSFSGRSRAAALARSRRKRSVPGPARAHLLARPRAAPRRRARVQRDGALGRAQGADRHRPRSPRCRLGGEPEPRDRGDARRHRRRFGLAAPQPHAEHRGRRDLGVVPPWRRRRHGLLAARRHGDRATAPMPRRSASSACCGTTRRAA